MQKRSQNPYQARENVSRVDPSNDSQMIRENLRVPKLLTPEFTREDRAKLKAFKSAYKKLKLNITLFRELNKPLLKAFRDHSEPKFGSLIFNGKRIE